MQLDPAASEALLRTRDREDFARLYDAFAPLVWGVCCKILRDKQEAEDVAQEVFTALWLKPEAFDSRRASLRTYLCVVARSRALDRLRRGHNRTKRVRLSERGEPEERALPLPGSDGAHPLEALVSARQRAKLEGLMAALSPAQAQALRLAYFQGLTQTEVAAALGLPLGTVKTHLSRGLKRLTLALQGQREDWL